MLLKTQEVPSGHDPDDYVTRRADGARRMTASWCRSRCSTAATRRSTARAPCLLYGYGSYGITVPAAFNTNALSLVDRGFVYAIAHVRGGKDKGFAWYEDGKRAQEDEHLPRFHRRGRASGRRAGYTAHDRIVAQGGSAGGMLMGAVANMAPRMFGGIIAEVPFVDVLDTMLDDNAAADAAGMARMGQSDRFGGRLPHDRRLFALRQCRRSTTIRRSWRSPG